MTRGAAGVLNFLAGRVLPRVEERSSRGLRRALRTDGEPAIVDIWLDDDRVRVDGALPATQAIAERVFDLDVDALEVAAALSSDPQLRPLVEDAPDMRLPGAFDGFETAIRAVLGQQVTLGAANTLAGRIVERWGEPVARPVGHVTHLFPAAASLAGADTSMLGMPRSRSTTIETLSAAVADGAIRLSDGADAAETYDALVAFPGVGPWTASYICMRALRDRDAFLASDLGVRKGAAVLGLPATPRELERHADRWRPFRSYAVMYLWTAARRVAP